MISARLRVYSAVGFLVSAAACASAAETTNVPNSLPELRAAIETILKDSRTPGAAIAIVSRNQVEWLAGIGWADVAANKPVTADTRFRLGSISKTFVALAALRLQEEGKLKLTDTVRQWVPEVAFTNPWEATDPVRLVHLLEHTSGFEDLHLRELALNDPTITLTNALAYGAASRVSRWPPGSRMAYCNSGPAVLAAVVEKVSGERFEDYVAQNIFKPLGMNSTGYFYTPEVERQLAKLYHPDGITPYPYWHIALRPTAAVSTSARDMANYLRFFLQRGSLGGTQILSPASLDRMETGETLPSAKLGPIANYGLFNHPILDGPFVFHGHSGAVMGGIAQIAYLPDHGRGYALMLNSGSFTAMFQIGKLVRHYLTRDLTPPALPPEVAVPAALKHQYKGYYELISSQAEWFYGFERLLNVKILTFAGDHLSTSTYGLLQKHWAPTAERLFRQEDKSLASLALLPDADGRILVQHGEATFQKVSALRIWAQLIGMGLIGLLMLSSFIFAIVCGFKKLFGKLPRPVPRWLLILPSVSAASLVVFDVLIFSGLRGVITSTYVDDVNLGAPTLLTVSVMLTSIVFPLAAVAALYVAYRARKTPMNRLVYWHSVLVSSAMLAVTVYYGYWGLIGLRLWA